MKIDIKSLNLKELTIFMEGLGEKSFRAKKIYQWLHVKQVDRFEEMKNISKALIEQLKEILRKDELMILIEHLIYGYSFKELSRIYKKPLNTIKTIYLRAKRKLKERCERNEF